MQGDFRFAHLFSGVAMNESCENQNVVDKFLFCINKAVEWLSIAMFIVIFFAAMAQIVMRWLLHNPLVWSEELTRLLFVWICFLGWTMGTHNGSHIKITALYSRLGKIGKKLLSTFNMILIILFSVLMCFYGMEMVKRVGSTAVTIPWFTFKMVYFSCPVGNGLIIIYTLVDLFRLWFTKQSVEVSV